MSGSIKRYRLVDYAQDVVSRSGFCKHCGVLFRIHDGGSAKAGAMKGTLRFLESHLEPRVIFFMCCKCKGLTLLEEVVFPKRLPPPTGTLPNESTVRSLARLGMVAEFYPNKTGWRAAPILIGNDNEQR